MYTLLTSTSWVYFRFRVWRLKLRFYGHATVIRFKQDWELQAATCFALALMLLAHR